MKVRPLQDRVIVKRLEAESVSAGGIIIPDNAKEKPVRGKVLAVGEGRFLDSGERQPVDCKPDDVVLFQKYGGSEVTIEGEDYLIIKNEDILGVIEQTPAA